jgi:hypothetical protein
MASNTWLSVQEIAFTPLHSPTSLQQGPLR